jgi:methylmalonyl-CoA mutase cobalamin-binding subunit
LARPTAIKELGVEGAFGPGTSIEEIVRFTHEQLDIRL